MDELGKLNIVCSVWSAFRRQMPSWILFDPEKSIRTDMATTTDLVRLNNSGSTSPDALFLVQWGWQDDGDGTMMEMAPQVQEFPRSVWCSGMRVTLVCPGFPAVNKAIFVLIYPAISVQLNYSVPVRIPVRI